MKRLRVKRLRDTSIRTKITLWFSAALVLVIILTYFVILSASWQVIRKTIHDNLIETVTHNIDEVEYYTSLDAENQNNEVDYYVSYGDGFLEIDDDFLDEVNEVHTSLCQSDGTLIYGENPIARYTADLSFEDAEIQTVDADGTEYFVYDIYLNGEGLEGLWLRGVVSETQGEVQLSSISRISLILLPSLVLIAILGGILIARRTLRPIDQISDTAARIRQGDDLKQRIELGEGGDELHRLADQFNEMFARLDDSFQAQQQFVSDASHELRTPVSVILAQCELTLEQERTTPEYVESLRVIQRQGRRMNRLVSDMLDYCRLELQPERYGKEEFDLTELTEDICTDMALIREKDITLTWELAPAVRVCGNRMLLSRLLTNLLSNAYRYGSPGGHTKVRLTAEEEHICLSVQDDGIGIAPEEQEHIFRRFYQVDASRGGAGSGLGLAMVQGIAHFHGGVVRVESTPGQGSTFTLEMPSGLNS
ncbi:MAG: HAMP domain-containing histidine kinase [Lachnospiraceae bacterium]|nr:HAMP domain-containing histidine kinase [Lachnospiraceae bacterium]